jgi:hypothetical protein
MANRKSIANTPTSQESTENFHDQPAEMSKSTLKQLVNPCPYPNHIIPTGSDYSDQIVHPLRTIPSKFSEFY